MSGLINMTTYTTSNSSAAFSTRYLCPRVNGSKEPVTAAAVAFPISSISEDPYGRESIILYPEGTGVGESSRARSTAMTPPRDSMPASATAFTAASAIPFLYGGSTKTTSKDLPLFFNPATTLSKSPRSTE